MIVDVVDFSIKEKWGCVNNDEGQPVCYGDSPASLSDLEFDDISTFRPCKHLKLGKDILFFNI